MSEPSNNLIDNFGRIAKKLRISVTDRCNMQCIYCMPKNNTDWFEQGNILSYEEILRIVTILVDIGIERIRITGGEPLVRPKLTSLIKALSHVQRVKEISMTTNGIGLKSVARHLRGAGLNSINVSLDTFKEGKFKRISGVCGLKDVLGGIYAADNAGLAVKINTVIIRGWNDDEVVDFAEFARRTGHTVRFIEFMPLDGSRIWGADLVVSKNEMLQTLTNTINKLRPVTNDVSEPAKLFTFIDGIGTIGFIPSISEPFCSNCDRLRLTSDGKLLTCLYQKPGFDLKSFLRADKSNDEIKESVLEAMRSKPEGIIRLIRNKSLSPSMNVMHKIGG